MNFADIKKGLIFVHAHQLAPHEWSGGRHATCTVTKVAQGTVYYRNETGYLLKVSVDKFPEIVLEEADPRIHYTSTPNATAPQIACGRTGTTEQVTGAHGDVSCPDCQTSTAYLAYLWKLRNS